ncbi:glycerophosphodiester phosphodiesterase family protein [Paenibacillus sp. GP183]|jgi:glycerophosphoryl diester phosphodiesterase|uniref:glycerophosphodiester phosphodiesterase n=1 Tax=Paenibacillus sp. GP183 TaxID=1882751 RepID=UPI000894D23E|nr:glycerophosphodiester phosphodiesterase family protein [Paenibacillus sp. GP183]SEB40233.1 glycerophosphoryl diester phosphodiesterase [Paenibacillus sp. GP183]
MQKFFLILILLFLSNFATAESVTTSHGNSDNRVMAHRGSSRTAPENTVSSIRKAIQDGAGYAEIDLQETADGVVVLMHDYNVHRTTGINKNMWEIRFEELRQASAGEWFNPRFHEEKVPTFEEVVNTAKGNIKLNIELKNNGHQKRLAEKTVEILKQKHFNHDCVVTSFDVGLLKTVKSLDREIKTGLIIGDKPATLENVLKSQDYEAISINYTVINQDFIKLAKENHKEVFAWTVNDPKIMSDLLNLGVNNIITNHPDRLIQLLHKT